MTTEMICLGCGNSDPEQFHGVHVGSPMDPVETEAMCNICGCTQIAESVEEVLERLYTSSDSERREVGKMLTVEVLVPLLENNF